MNRAAKRLISDGPPRERHHPLRDGEVKITTFVPLKFKKRGIKKVVVGPEGVVSPVSVNALHPAIKPNHDSPLIKALGRCYYWQHLLDTGVVEDTVEIAKREGLSKVTVNETLRLVALAPDIANAILNGSLPRTVSRQLLVRITLPSDWGKQAEMIAGIG